MFCKIEETLNHLQIVWKKIKLKKYSNWVVIIAGAKVIVGTSAEGKQVV